MSMNCEVHAVKLVDGDPQGLLKRASAGDNPSVVNLQKSWHGLHFLLTSSAAEGKPPLNFIMQGGEPVGEDHGYGPARLFRHEVVKDLDAALSGISDDQLWSRFDPSRMEEEMIYPVVWDEPEPELREEYLGYFHQLKELVHKASVGGMALLVVLN